MALPMDAMTTLFRADDVAMRAVSNKEFLETVSGFRSKFITEQVISDLEDRENEMFKFLGYNLGTSKANREALQQNIARRTDSIGLIDNSGNESVITDTVSNLFGKGLSASFIDRANQEQVNLRDVWQFLFDYYMPEIIGGQLAQTINSKNFQWDTVIAQYLNSKFDKKNNKFSASTGFQKGIEKGLSSVLVNSLSSRQFQLIKEEIIECLRNDQHVLAALREPLGLDNATIKNPQKIIDRLEKTAKMKGVDFFASNMRLDIKVEYEVKEDSFSWSNTTGGRSQSSLFEELEFDKNTTWKNLTSDQKQQVIDFLGNSTIENTINYNVTQAILQACPGADQELLQYCIDEILRAKPTAFLVGNATTGISGILGEIEALYLFGILFNKDFSKIEWTGGIFDPVTGAQPNVDIILQDIGNQRGYGIQVKNTTRDISSEWGSAIEFKSKSMENLLTELGFAPYEKSIIMSTFSLPYFNVKYKQKNGKYQQTQKTGNSYDNIYKQLEDNAKFATTLFDIFAASLMYMNAEDKWQDDKTLLYLVGGQMIVTVSSVLRDIKEADRRRFKVEANWKKSSSTYNIVDYFNEGGKRNNTHGLRMTAAKLLLTSSYQFKPMNYQ